MDQANGHPNTLVADVLMMTGDVDPGVRWRTTCAMSQVEDILELDIKSESMKARERKLNLLGGTCLDCGGKRGTAGLGKGSCWCRR